MSALSQQRILFKQRSITAAAHELIATQGLDNLSMRAVARQTSMSAANLYEYFNNKEDIVVAVFVTMISDLVAQLRQIDPHLAPEPYLLALALGCFEFFQCEQEQLLVLSATLPTIIQLYRTTDRTTGGKHPPHATAPLQALVTLFAAGVKRHVEGSTPTPRLGLCAGAIAHSLVIVIFGYVAVKVHNSPAAVNRLALHAIIRAFLDSTVTNNLRC